LITLSEGIVILHFEIHFERAGEYRLGNDLDDLTIALGIGRGRPSALRDHCNHGGLERRGDRFLTAARLDSGRPWLARSKR
jgi:hypothetical protein